MLQVRPGRLLKKSFFASLLGLMLPVSLQRNGAAQAFSV
jgi:hypothetical protein